MLALLAERLELIVALNEVNSAKVAFNSEREKRCKDRVIACEQ